MRLERISLRGASLGRVPLPRISLQGRTDGEPAQDFEGYPLELSVSRAKVMRDYTIFGNTSEDAKGVGDEVVNMVPPFDANQYRAGTRATYRIENGIVYGTHSVVGLQYVFSIPLSTIAEHKYFVRVKCYAPKSCQVRVGNYSTQVTIGNPTAGENGVFSGIYSSTIANNLLYGVTTNEEWTSADTWELSEPEYVDLTAMYGAGNEPATADDFAHRLGYADAAHLPAFNFGSNFVAPIRVGSRNLWDEEWEKGNFNAQGQEIADNNTFRSANYIKIDAQRTYYLCATRAVLFMWYDKDKNYISSNGVSANRIISPIPSNCAYARIRVNTPTYGNDICINLSDSRNGEYSPYFAPTLYPSVLSSPLHKIGDIVDYKESNGKEVHNFGVVDLGTLNWGDATMQRFSTSGIANIIRVPSALSVPANMRCSGLTVTSSDDTYNHKGSNIIGCALSGTLYVYAPDYTTAAAFKAAMQGVMLVYELATPTEVQGEPLPKIAVPKGESIVTLDTEVEPSNITAKV